MHLLSKILTITGSLITAGFGLWHFFVPGIWKWYSYIKPEASELVIAVRAINVFFSLCLVLLGIVNILFIYGNRTNKFSIITMLGVSCILWITRVVFQIVYPQGTEIPVVRYGMLITFLFVFLCFLTSLIIVLKSVFST